MTYKKRLTTLLSLLLVLLMAVSLCGCKLTPENEDPDEPEITDEPAVIRKKIMKAKSDSGPTEMNQQKPEEIENLFTLLKVVSTPDTVEYFNDLYNRCQIRYGDLKKQLAEDMVAFVEPLRQRILEYQSDDAHLRRIMDLGKEKAHASAAATLDEVRRVIGYRN